MVTGTVDGAAAEPDGGLLVAALDEQARLEEERIEDARRVIADATRRLDLVSRIRPLAAELAGEYTAGQARRAVAAVPVKEPPSRRPRGGTRGAAAGPAAGSRLGDAQLVDAVRAGGEVSARQIADRVGVHHSTVRKRLDRLVASGVLVRVRESRGRRGALYALPGPPDGRTEASGSSVAAAPSSGPGSSSNGASAPEANDPAAPAAPGSEQTTTPPPGPADVADLEGHGLDGEDLDDDGEHGVDGADPAVAVEDGGLEGRLADFVAEDEAVRGRGPAGEVGLGLSPRVARPGREAARTTAATAREMSAVRRAVLRLLVREFPVGPERAARLLVLNVREVAEEMLALAREGVIEPAAAGTYRLVDRQGMSAQLEQAEQAGSGVRA